MLLRECKEGIDQGKTAKLVIPPNRPDGIEITVRIKKVNGYTWQRAEITGPVAAIGNARPNTKAYPAWSTLLEAIKGMQMETTNWALCDDPLDPALPEWKPSPRSS